MSNNVITDILIDIYIDKLIAAITNYAAIRGVGKRIWTNTPTTCRLCHIWIILANTTIK
jgi:hypothetical protein